MTSKLVVNTIEADTGISSVSFASSISMNSTAKFHFSAAGVDIGADTNINRPAAGVLGFNVNGTEKVRIDTNGHIHGVGVVTATHFFGNGSNLTNLPVPTTITVADESTDTTCYPLFATATSGNLAPKTGTNLVFNSASGNLRAGSLFVGTATNESKTQDGLILERNSGDGEVHVTAGRSGGNYSGMNFYVAGASGVTKRHRIDYQSNFMWYGADGTSERFRIDSNGSVGINVANPGSYDPNAESLVIGEISGGDGHAGMTIVSGGTDKQGSIYFADGTGSASYRGRIEYKHDNDTLCLGAAGSGDKLVIDSSGNVIIRGSGLNNSSVAGQALQVNGTTRPTLILRGNASGGNTCEIQFADNSGTDSDPGTRVGLIKYEHAGTYANHMHFHTNETERVVISHAGRFGIANSAAELAGFAENLQVTGLYSSQYAAAFKIKQSSGSLMRFATTVSGSFNLCGGITVNGSSTSFNTSSDYRLKENDVKISDGITRLKQLRPIRFNWKTDSSTIEDGFFAHEVSPVVPESVNGEKDATIDEIGEGYQKIDHSKLVPLLTAALQEAIAEIETLKTKVTALEGS